MSGTSCNGTIYNYYSCNNSRKKKCHKRNVQKEYIENIVIEKARNILTDNHINIIANAIYELAQKEMKNNTNLKRLTKRLKDNEQQKKNLIDSLKMCNIDSARQAIFEEMQKMEEERQEIEKELLLEDMQKVDITVPEIKFFLKEMRSGKIDDIEYCKMLVNVLIYKVYLYDDSITIIFNTQNKPYKEKIPLIEELEEKLGASSYKVRSAQPMKITTFKKLRVVIFYIFDSELSEKHIIVASSNAGEIGHCIKDKKTVKEKFIKFFRNY